MNIDRFLLVMKIMEMVEDSVNCECTSMGATNTAGLRTRWSCSTFPFSTEVVFWQIATCIDKEVPRSTPFLRVLFSSQCWCVVQRRLFIASVNLFRCFFDYFSAT